MTVPKNDVGISEDAVERRSDFMAHGSQELGLRLVRLLCCLLRDFQLDRLVSTFGDILNGPNGTDRCSILIQESFPVERDPALGPVIGSDYPELCLVTPVRRLCDAAEKRSATHSRSSG